VSLISIPEIVEGIPNISGWDEEIEAAVLGRGPAAFDRLPLSPDHIQAAFAVGLHMHQPIIVEGHDLRTAPLIGNLQYMMENQHIHGCHDAPVFAMCYGRMADFIRDLVQAGRQPRVMLDYSGCLLFGLRQMGRGDILDRLKSVTIDDRYRNCVEWLGTFWGHAVAPSTPVPDVRLHLRAWQHHFAAVFGEEALERVRGFSPPEMALPNHPDVSWEFVRALRECGYEWLVVQEHSVEEPDGQGLRERYLPRRLVVRNSHGEESSITALIKTQGSDTKLVGQMQPFHEARGMCRREFNGRLVPPLVMQVSDGENGGVMMNEFPGNYMQVWREAGAPGTVGLNGTEYLELLRMSGVETGDFAPIQPVHQHAIWQRVGRDVTTGSVERAIEDARKSVPRFHMEGGSWTNNISWVQNYGHVVTPMCALSALFHEKLDRRPVDRRSHAYRNALLHLLASQTSCYRYWGEGRWTDYAREICRRGSDILNCDF